jgi:hypothetical protein
MNVDPFRQTDHVSVCGGRVRTTPGYDNSGKSVASAAAVHVF